MSPYLYTFVTKPINMSLRETIIRHQLIVNKLRIRPRTWQEISTALQNESDLTGFDLKVSLRTFQRDVKDILSVYGISIENDPQSKRYHMADEGAGLHRRLETMDVLNLLRIGGNDTPSISFEKRRPKGVEHAYAIVQAINANQSVSFEYRKFHKSSSESRVLEPYLLKESRNRWYVVGKDVHKNAIRVFALDRISGLSLQKKRFEAPSGVDIDGLFKHVFGVILPDSGQQLEEIILSISAFQGKYVKTFPLHESQEIISEDDEAIRIRLRIYVTHDFVMELLSLGEEVEVIKPASLIGKLKRHYEGALTYYPVI